MNQNSSRDDLTSVIPISLIIDVCLCFRRNPEAGRVRFKNGPARQSVSVSAGSAPFRLHRTLNPQFRSICLKRQTLPVLRIESDSSGRTACRSGECRWSLVPTFPICPVLSGFPDLGGGNRYVFSLAFILRLGRAHATGSFSRSGVLEKLTRAAGLGSRRRNNQ